MKKTSLIPVVFAALIMISCGGSTEAQKTRLNPTPHSVEYTAGKTIELANGLALSPQNAALPKHLAAALSFANGKDGALPITVTFGTDVASQNGVKADDGAYLLEVTEGGVNIVGYNERGAYYGVQTLKQLINNNEIEVVKILDHADIPYRGVVEGFYGTPWSHEVRRSLIDYYGQYKLNSYLYGPKDDPYHSSLAGHGKEEVDPNAPTWRDPYPEADAAKIKELVEASNRNYVDFIWAIHPGGDIQWIESDYQKLLAKFNSMYDLGVRSFAVFFDDISGIGTKADRQAELLNRLHTEFVEAKGDVKPLIMCPTDYTRLWADPSETGYLSLLGDTLHPSIHVMWTGDAVCCDITDGSLEWVNSRINRPTFIWWNYPVTDYVKHIMLQGPVYGNSEVADRGDMAGFVSNPMEHGEASKIALYGVADYTWNVENYKPIENWEGAIKSLMPAAADAYRTFAIHSTDTETGYRRDESWETEIFDIDNYTPEQYEALYAEFQKVKDAPATIIAKGGNELLISELKPWLVEFEKLGQRGLNTMELIKKMESKDFAGFWDGFHSSAMSEEELTTYKAHRSGTTKLMPFINKTRGDLALDFYTELSGKPTYETTPISSFENVSKRDLSSLMLDGKSDTYYHSAMAQKAGDWVGVDLGTETTIHHIYIEQGRNNVDDVDYFDSSTLEASKDGKDWTSLIGKLGKSDYVIDYRSDDNAPREYRYIRLRRLEDSERKNWLAVRRFDVNPTLEEPRLITSVPQLSKVKATLANNKVSVAKILEVVGVDNNDYFGVELPVVSSIGAVDAKIIGGEGIELQYSLNGTEWNKIPQQGGVSARYIRGINTSGKKLNINIEGVTIELLSSGGGNTNRLVDEKIATSYAVEGSVRLVVPEGSKEVTILNAGDKFEIAQLDAHGSELAKEAATASLTTLTLNDRTTGIELRGNGEVFEVIFK